MKMPTKSTLAMFAVPLTAGLLAVPADAQQRRYDPHPQQPERWADWETIGTTTIAGRRDRDTISVRGNDRHRQIRVCAVNNSIRLLDLDARFANGGRQDIRTRQFIRSGDCTAPKDLNGRWRNLRSVTIVYEKVRGILPIVRIQAR
ncbi:MAG TPA: hypothetical protein VGE65_03160 [Sphingobium sp.]